jgi:thymidylate synthase
MEMSYNKEEQVNYIIEEEMNPHEHQMVKLADYMGDKIAVKRGNASLPWVTTRLQEAESKVAEVRAYVYTIYRLNAIKDEEIDRFNGKPLDKWRCLPVFADLVIPAAVKYDSAGKYEDLLDRSIYELDTKFFNKGTEYGYLMSLDQFNDFTDWVQATFNFAADQITTFDKLRTIVNLASVKDRVGYKGKTEGFGQYPLDLTIRLHKKNRLNESSFEVTKDYVEAQILEKYKRRGGKSDPATKTE